MAALILAGADDLTLSAGAAGALTITPTGPYRDVIVHCISATAPVALKVTTDGNAPANATVYTDGGQIVTGPHIGARSLGLSGQASGSGSNAAFKVSGFSSAAAVVYFELIR